MLLTTRLILSPILPLSQVCINLFHLSVWDQTEMKE